VDGNFDNPITQATTWNASVNDVGQWYGSDFSVVNNSANLNSPTYSYGNSAQRSLIQVLPITTAGTYEWSFNHKISDYDSQWSYWQVYLLKEDATINLKGGPNYGQTLPETRLISKDYAPTGKDDGRWHSYSDQFTISDSDIRNYQYAAFIMTGSLYSPCQVFGYQNLMTTMAVPEPATLGLLALGGGWFLLRKPRRSGQTDKQ
jgi:hypothetical protein